ncbi:MAG: RNA-binding cell elongation regulator Jag/EloR [Elusimicrobiota bacterium]
MKEIEIQGKSIEEAVKLGLEQLGVTKDDVDIRVLDEGKSGLFGLMGSSPARIKMTLKCGEGEYTPKNAEEYHEIAECVQNHVEKIIKLMKFKASVKTAFLGGRILADIEGEDASIIIGKRGQTLEALETLVNLMICREERAKVKVTLDVESYKARREEKVCSQAKTLAKQVKETGNEFEMMPMPAYERRIVHVTLEKDKDITTESIGEGADRRVVIKLNKTKTSFK